jgi:methionine biosynthesis protein MetW
MLTSGPTVRGQMPSPDQSASGLVRGVIDPLRYDVDRTFDPDEVTGIVASLLPRGARVLDVGCGAGSLAQVLSGKVSGTEFLGIEPDALRAERARSRGLDVRVGYLSQKVIREVGLFDIVLLADVLEHLPDPQSILLTAREALKPGGAIIVSVPNVAHWSVRLCLLRGIFQYQPHGIMDATHLRWFTADSIKSLLASSGFKVIECRATAGRGLPENDWRAPLRWLSASQRARFLRVACRRWPTLFGAQYVLKAETL